MLDRTPFYAEGGGQLADQGVIRLSNGALVAGQGRADADRRAWSCTGRPWSSGEVTLGLGAYAEVDVERRRAISRSHTATHLIHKAFRDALGETATQAGSRELAGPVPVRLRLAERGAGLGARRRRGQGQRGARRGPRRVRRADEPGGGRARSARWRCSARSTATRSGWSRSATTPASCAAARTCARSGQLGLVKLLGEASIGAGVRRVEALVGVDAYRFLATRARPGRAAHRDAQGRARRSCPSGSRGIVARLRDAEKEIERMRAGAGARGAPAGSPPRRRDVYGVALVAHRAPDGTTADDVRKLALDVRGRIPADRPAVVAVTAVAGERPVGGRGGQRGRPRAGASRPASWSGSRPRRSAAVAAARTTSPRAAAPTPVVWTRRCGRSSTPSPAGSPAAPEPDEEGRTGRGRCRYRPHRSRRV